MYGGRVVQGHCGKEQQLVISARRINYCLSAVVALQKQSLNSLESMLLFIFLFHVLLCVGVVLPSIAKCVEMGLGSSVYRLFFFSVESINERVFILRMCFRNWRFVLFGGVPYLKVTQENSSLMPTDVQLQCFPDFYEFPDIFLNRVRL